VRWTKSLQLKIRDPQGSRNCLRCERSFCRQLFFAQDRMLYPFPSEMVWAKELEGFLWSVVLRRRGSAGGGSSRGVAYRGESIE
jgi:hypothetical protein